MKGDNSFSITAVVTILVGLHCAFMFIYTDNILFAMWIRTHIGNYYKKFEE